MKIRTMKTRNLALAALMAALTAAGSLIKIPAPVAPITMQVFFTLAAGVLLGEKYGALSQIVYLVMGLLGLPVFSTGGGIGYLLRPSFGFVLGFIVAAWIAGRMSRSEKRFSRLVIACLAATLAMYVLAIPYMYCIFNLYMGRAYNIIYVLQTGMLIYLPGDILKCLLCALVASRLPAAMRLNS